MGWGSGQREAGLVEQGCCPGVPSPAIPYPFWPEVAEGRQGPWHPVARLGAEAFVGSRDGQSLAMPCIHCAVEQHAYSVQEHGVDREREQHGQHHHPGPDHQRRVFLCLRAGHQDLPGFGRAADAQVGAGVRRAASPITRAREHAGGGRGGESPKLGTESGVCSLSSV